MDASRIIKIHMDNFGGLQDTEGSRTIGSFASFTILCGKTAHGKTTTVRAIAFALGDMPRSRTTETGRVTMTIGRGKKEKVFERSRDQENDLYFVDNASVTEQAYLQQLQSEGVNLQMRMHMVHKNGTYADLILQVKADIAGLLEDQSGTSEFKQQYNKLQNELKGATSESEDADLENESSQEVKKLEKELEEVKEKRRREFNKFFIPMNTRLDEVYKSIYGCQKVTLKMVPTVKDEPYLGVSFECMPYRHGTTPIDVELLSGGEKKVASVAFLLALNLVKGSSFIVLDELDKAFHKDTCVKVGPALQELGKEMQIVAVCNDKHMRRFATKQITVKLEDD
ncbi:unnamed protein product [Caenorhabditis brenneri]